MKKQKTEDGSPIPSNDESRKIQHELDCLSKARSQMISRMHYSTVDEILRNSGLPYLLVQEFKNDLGEHVSGYRYRFTSKWDSSAALYIQETMAGRQFCSMGKALDVLEMVLRDHLRHAKYGMGVRA